MSDLKRFSRLGQVDFLNSGNPTASIIGARVGHEWCNYTTGTIWTCVDDTFGSQRWESDDGFAVVPITAADHPDLLAMYTMDEIIGNTLVDESPNGNDGTITGAVAETGHIGNALGFGSTSQTYYVLTPNAVNPAAICFWHKQDGTEACYGYARGASAANDRFWAISALASGGLAVLGQDGATYTQIDTVETVTSGTYGFFVVQLNAGVLEIYINGALATKSQAAGSNINLWYTDLSDPPTETKIGTIPRTAADNIGSGAVDHHRQYRRPLTQTEISTLYAGGTGA